MKELEKAHKLALEVRDRAYSPYSTFRVGCVLKLEGRDGFIVGCNVENASYGATICAERSSVLQAIALTGKAKAEFILVATHGDDPAVPCALCLQVLAEFNDENLKIYLANDERIVKEWKLKELLPHPFKSFDPTPPLS